MDSDLTVAIPDFDKHNDLEAIPKPPYVKRAKPNPLPGSRITKPYEHPVIFEELTGVEDARDLQDWEVSILAEEYAQKQHEQGVKNIVAVLSPDEEIRAEVHMDRLNDPTEYSDKAYELEDDDVPHFNLED